MLLEKLTGIVDGLQVVARDLYAGEYDGPDAVEFMVQVGRVSRDLAALSGPMSKRVDETQAYVVHGDRSAAELCARVVGVATSDAKRVIENAVRLESLPATESAFRAGLLSVEKASLLSKVAVVHPSLEAELLAQADQGLVPFRDACVAAQARTEDPAARAKRQHAARSLRMWNADDGMLEGRFALTPEVGAGLKAAIDAKTREVFRAKSREGVREDHDAYAADALTDLVLGPATGRVGTTVHVMIDHAALVRGYARPGERCDIPGTGSVSVSWVREELGEAFVTAIMTKGEDITTIAHLGRYIPAKLRTAMIVGGRECCVDGCHARGYLELDHSEVDFAKGGPTAKWNLGWLCSPDHGRKSKGWKLGPPDPETGKRILAPPGRSAPAIIGTPQPKLDRAARKARARVLLGVQGNSP